MELLHGRLAVSLVLYFLAAGVWNLVAALRRRSLAPQTWGILAIGELLALAQGTIGLVLYVLVPRTADLLFNLESNTLVVATADTWQARGLARLLTPGEYPDRLAIASTPAAVWCEVVEIRPTRLRLRPPGGQGEGETIDIW